MSRIIKAPFISLDNENKVNIEVMPKESFFPGGHEEKGKETAQVTAAMITEKARVNANSILDGARAEAERIMKEARRNAQEYCDKLKIEVEEAAKKEGYDNGYNKGKAESDRLISEADAYRKQIEKECENTKIALEPEIVALITDICKSLVGANIRINPQAILFAVKRGLSQAQKLTDVTIRVSQEDYETLLSSKGMILETLDSSASIEIIRDVTLTAGDCIIETPHGDIDSSIGRQLEGLIIDLNVIFDNR